MKISDKNSEYNVYDKYEDAERELTKYNGYAIVSFKIKGKKYWMVTYE